MKSRAVKAIIVVLCIAALTLGICGTIAYVSPEKDAVNIITMGNIKIKAYSKTIDSEGKIKEFSGEAMFMPSREISWQLSVENVGDNSAFIRVRLNKALTLAVEGEADTGLISFNINEADWTFKDGLFYYNHILEPGEMTAPLFTKVIFDASAGNIYQGAVADVSADIGAVQSANNGTDPLNTAGWPEM